MSADELGAATVDRWLQPLPDESAPCGPDLEYDNEFLALNQSAAGKPESQFDAGSPPDWRAVREQAQTLFERTRDLRIAVLWLRAGVNLDGFAALPQGLRLLHGLMANFWDQLNPVPDDGDAYARMNALAVLADYGGLLGDLRNATLFNLRGVGDLRIRAIEIALNMLAPRDDDAAVSRDQITQMLTGAIEQNPGLRKLPASALEQLKALTSFVHERVGVEAAPDLKPLHTLLKGIQGLVPAPADDGSAEDGGSAGAEGGGPAKGRLSGGIHTRDDAMRAIDMICEFLERTEPTSPAPLLLRRARRMINRNFLQLIKDLAPEALPAVSNVMGVNPDSIQLDD